MNTFIICGVLYYAGRHPIHLCRRSYRRLIWKEGSPPALVGALYNSFRDAWHFLGSSGWHVCEFYGRSPSGPSLIVWGKGLRQGKTEAAICPVCLNTGCFVLAIVKKVSMGTATYILWMFWDILSILLLHLVNLCYTIEILLLFYLFPFHYMLFCCHHNR